MKAARIYSFGPPNVVVVEDVPMPSPGPGEVLVRVMAAGVAAWDAIIREGKSKVSPQPPLTLGSDLSGVVEQVGPGVTDFAPADEVYGVTNPQLRSMPACAHGRRSPHHRRGRRASTDGCRQRASIAGSRDR